MLVVGGARAVSASSAERRSLSSHGSGGSRMRASSALCARSVRTLNRSQPTMTARPSTWNDTNPTKELSAGSSACASRDSRDLNAESSRPGAHAGSGWCAGKLYSTRAGVATGESLTTSMCRSVHRSGSGPKVKSSDVRASSARTTVASASTRATPLPLAECTGSPPIKPVVLTVSLSRSCCTSLEAHSWAAAKAEIGWCLRSSCRYHSPPPASTPAREAPPAANAFSDAPSSENLAKRSMAVGEAGASPSGPLGSPSEFSPRRETASHGSRTNKYLGFVNGKSAHWSDGRICGLFS
eukprot:scaffold102084_cov63-Phaeocystis_antarctica.AAC.2